MRTSQGANQSQGFGRVQNPPGSDEVVAQLDKQARLDRRRRVLAALIGNVMTQTEADDLCAQIQAMVPSDGE